LPSLEGTTSSRRAPSPIQHLAQKKPTGPRWVFWFLAIFLYGTVSTTVWLLELVPAAAVMVIV